MAAVWKGSIAFGLVNVPVRLHAATQDHDVSFHQVHDADGGRIRYRRVCEECGEIVEFHHIAKQYTAASGATVIVDDDELSSLPVSQSREIEVVEFVPGDQVDPILFDRSYFLEPDERSVKAYLLLREVLNRTSRVALTKVSLRSKTRLAALRVYQDVILLQTMLWPDEVRAPSFTVLDAGIEFSARELKLAEAVVGSLESDFHPGEYQDTYRQQLIELLEAKAESGESPFAGPAGAATPQGAQVVDLVSALQASLRARGVTGATDEADADERNAPPSRKQA